MRAMILAAGLGTRLRPLTDYCAKPALPIRGRPVISLLLDFLHRHAIREVMINLHYLPQTIRAAVESDCPADMSVIWSDEPEPLGTGGGIRGAADFLSESDDCVVLAGDMLLDLDLAGLLDRHRRSDRDATLVLRDDARGDAFGTIGVDAEGRVTRVGKRIASGVETRAGLFTGVRLLSKRVFAHWPERTIFEDLRDWLMPAMDAGLVRLGADFVDASNSVWEPVGTPAEYLRVNLMPPCLPSLGGSAEHWSGDVEVGARDVILGSQSQVGKNARLERVVVWANESVPPSLVAHDGVFAAGHFHACGHDCGIREGRPGTAVVRQVS